MPTGGGARGPLQLGRPLDPLGFEFLVNVGLGLPGRIVLFARDGTVFPIDEILDIAVGSATLFEDSTCSVEGIFRIRLSESWRRTTALTIGGPRLLTKLKRRWW